MKIILANPRGFCAGVDRAINIVENAIEKYGAPIYVKNEIVHNKSVVNSLNERGAVFVKNIADVPNESVIIFSAHGAAKKSYLEAEAKSLTVLDASCPLVKRVHTNIRKYSKEGAKIILIGHKGHPEVEGHLGQIEEEIFLVSKLEDVDSLEFGDGEKLAYITQTTLSKMESKSVISRLKDKFPQIIGPEKGDLCYATTNRQKAIEKLSQEIDLLLVVGSANSSNSNRLKELGESLNIKSYLIDEPKDVDFVWLEGKKNIGITSGASAPEYLVQELLKKIAANFKVEKIEEMQANDEKIKFPMPSNLK